MKRSTHCGIRCAVVFWAVGFFGIPQIGAATIYVSTAGSDANDGLTWPTAKLTVQAGLDTAASGDQVWVAAGTYVENITLKDGVALYGGFAGTETDLGQRNWTTNATILDRNQVGSVVTVPLGATQTTRIDGFTIRNGRGSDGAGIYCPHASPVITNNTITGNTTSFYGGGIACYAFSSPLITHNIIKSNSADSGGGIYCYGSSPTIAGNIIAGNTAGGDGWGRGAGIYCDNLSSPLIVNNMIAGNGARTNGGGIYCYSTSSPTIVNNTIVGNSPGGVYTASTTGMIANTIIAFNSYGITKTALANPSLRYNCVYGNDSHDYSGLSDPTGTNGNISADPKLADVSYRNLHIQPDSPCLDAGDDSVVQAGWTDIDGQSRILGVHVDIGADESDGTAWAGGPNIIVRVAPEGSDANDGSSWAQAKQTVRAGIDAAAVSGGEVWVKAGTYVQRIWLQAYAHVYGGFAGTETQRAGRDWTQNQTILDGSGSGNVVTAYHIPPGISTIDGFTIRNGATLPGAGIYCDYASPTIADNLITGNSATGPGGGVYCFAASLTLLNNTITGNSASASGGGIYCSRSAVRIIGNTITRNTAASYGGGISTEGSDNSAVIVNNTIAGNAALDGGGVNVNASPPGSTIANNVISDNTASRNGGGIWLGRTSLAIADNAITANSASSNGGGIYSYSPASAFPTIANTIIAFNSSGLYTYGATAPIVRYNCVFGNTAYNYSGLTDPTGTNGNISADPTFVRQASPGPDGTWGTPDDDYGDLRLLPGSPCIDAGNNADVPARILTDLGGYPRFLDDPATPDCQWAPGTCGTPPIVDMGAYEFAADTDGDGVPDFQDDCPDSDFGQTIVINGVNTGVPNQPLGGGCTMADEIAKLAADAANHGAFVDAVDQLTDSWVAAGLITDAQKGRIQSAAGRSRIPGDINADGFVDASDLLLLAGSFGKLVGDSVADVICDLNLDGAVDVSDLLILASNWGM